MKTENKIKVLDLISPEMREVIKFYENSISNIIRDWLIPSNCTLVHK